MLRITIMDNHEHHLDIINGIKNQLKEIFENSEQGIYIYLDDTHKICNQKFALLLGYKSPKEWASVDKSFISAFVAKESQEKLVCSYQKVMERMAASTNKIIWKKKDGTSLKTNVVIAPITFNGHLMAIHFISEITS